MRNFKRLAFPKKAKQTWELFLFSEVKSIFEVIFNLEKSLKVQDITFSLSKKNPQKLPQKITLQGYRN